MLCMNKSCEFKVHFFSANPKYYMCEYVLLVYVKLFQNVGGDTIWDHLRGGHSCPIPLPKGGVLLPLACAQSMVWLAVTDYYHPFWWLQMRILPLSISHGRTQENFGNTELSLGAESYPSIRRRSVMTWKDLKAKKDGKILVIILEWTLFEAVCQKVLGFL